MYQFKKLFLILLSTTLLFAFNNCAEGFKATHSSESSDLSSSTPSPSVKAPQVKLQTMGDEIYVTSGLSSSDPNMTFSWSVSNSLSGSYENLDTQESKLNLKALGENFDGYVMLTLLMKSDSFEYKVSSAPLKVNVSKLAPVIDSDLVHRYSFDESSGSTAGDSAGDRPGSLVNASFAPGVLGSAVQFTGVNSSVNLGSINVSGNQLTISAYIKVSAFTNQDGRVISKAKGVQTQDHFFMLSTINSDAKSKLRFRLRTAGNTSTLIAANSEVIVNQWTHVVAVYDGTAMIIYQDGKEVGRLSKTGNMDESSTVKTTIGINPDGKAALNGLIDDVQIYKRALSVVEINELSELCTVCTEVAPAPEPMPTPIPAPAPTPTPGGSDLINVIDFEDGYTGIADNHDSLHASGNTPLIVTAENAITPRSGKYMMKTYLNRKTSATNYRTEVSLKKPSTFTKGKEYWLGLSVYLPANWSTDYGSVYSGGIVWQFHGRAYNNPEEWRTILPITAMHTENGWSIRNHSYSSHTVNAQKGLGNLVKFSKVAPYKLGQWNDFVLNFKFSGNISPNDTNGFIKVWVNGDLKVDIKGQTYFGEQEQGPYFKMGIYNWGWRNEHIDQWVGPDERTLYHDELRIGGANSSYSDVSPPEK